MRTVEVVSVAIRDQSPGFHHVVARGNNKRTTFTRRADRRFFFLTLDRVATKYDWQIIAYCLMDNHYHLVLKIGDQGLGDGMCELNTAYATWFNAQYGRMNHLFGRRYWNRRLTTEAAAQNAVRYVLQNPRRAGLCSRLEDFPWSSYAATVGLASASVELARDELFPFFGETREKAISELVAFCAILVKGDNDKPYDEPGTVRLPRRRAEPFAVRRVLNGHGRRQPPKKE